MDYISVIWQHLDPDEPILLLSELDDQRWEIRKVEVFQNRTADFAEATRHSGSTELGLLPVPTLAKIAEETEFRPRQITKEEFERVWQDAVNRGIFSLLDPHD